MKSIKKSITPMLQPALELHAGLNLSKPASTSATPRHNAWPAALFPSNFWTSRATCRCARGLATAWLLVFATLSVMAGSTAAQEPP